MAADAALKAAPDDDLDAADALDAAAQDAYDDYDFQLKLYALQTRRLAMIAEMVDGHGVAVCGPLASTHDMIAGTIDDADVTSARNLFLVACYRAAGAILKES